jgi:hypothetical protein
MHGLQSIHKINQGFRDYFSQAAYRNRETGQLESFEVITHWILSFGIDQAVSAIPADQFDDNLVKRYPYGGALPVALRGGVYHLFDRVGV